MIDGEQEMHVFMAVTSPVRIGNPFSISLCRLPSANTYLGIIQENCKTTNGRTPLPSTKLHGDTIGCLLLK